MRLSNDFLLHVDLGLGEQADLATLKQLQVRLPYNEIHEKTYVKRILWLLRDVNGTEVVDSGVTLPSLHMPETFLELGGGQPLAVQSDIGVFGYEAIEGIVVLLLGVGLVKGGDVSLSPVNEWAVVSHCFDVRVVMRIKWEVGVLSINAGTARPKPHFILKLNAV